MNTQLRHFLIGSSLILTACDVEDELDLDEVDEPAEIPSMEIEATNNSQVVTIDGLDSDCVDVLAPIIVRIDPTVTTCEFSGFQPLFGNTWEPTTLFLDGTPMLQGLSDPIPSTSPLREFCRYDYIGARAARHTNYAAFMNHLDSFNGPPGVDGASAAVDCPVIAPMSDEGLNTEGAREALHEAFMANIHAVSGSDLANVTLRPTRVAVLDTVQEGMVPLNDHGSLLEDLIADIACPGIRQTCLDKTQHVLVTPRVAADDYADPHWYSGGDVGYMHEFAAGLGFAVLDWSESNLDMPVGDRQRLVVSAAIGADPNHPIASDPDYAPAQSAIVALEAAYCLGAVVYAAAGNLRDTSCPDSETGMLAPARWEEREVPSAAECVMWGYAPDLPSYTYSPGSPLIHAVGGRTGSDQRIPNQRREANPRLDATASDAVSHSGMKVGTGTSVATGVAVATHVLSWMIDRNQRAAAVEQQIYSAGYSIGEDADAGAFPNSPIRRLGVCQAIRPLVPNLTCDSPAPDPDGNLGVYATAVEDALSDALSEDLLIVEPDPVTGEEPDCSEGPDHDTFIIPQPDRPQCHWCGGFLSATSNNQQLNMSITEAPWATDQIVVEAYLNTYDATHNVTVFNLSAYLTTINEADPTNIIQVTFQVPAPDSAVLQFNYYDPTYGTITKVTNPIPLL